MSLGFLTRILLTTLLFLAMGWGIWTVFSTPGLKPVVISVYEPPILQANEQTHDLGRVLTDSKAKHTFHLYNVGGKRLHIHHVETSCGCTVAKLSQKQINPGDVASLTVTLDTSIKLGAIQKTITVYSDDPQHPHYELYLTGEVLPQMKGHQRIAVKDPLVLFKGECATCHVQRGKGKSGQSLFQADCGMCHGMKAEGKVAPPLTHQNYQNPQTLEQLKKVISNGTPHNPEMPPFSQAKGGPLTEDEINSLITFLKFNAQQSKK